ncbi:MAG: P-loop NTPase, partial [Bdellovibrionales bacterium]|nr:P-loop NTPase [Bdellovibrionales bacterium]
MNNTLRGSLQAGSVLVAIGGGKGGIGKSFVSSNLGIFLANMGFNTVIVDLDLGAPNLHTALGELPPNKNFHEFINGKYKNISEAAVATRFPNLRFISGANDHSELANISIEEQSRLMSALYRLEA